MKQKAHIDIIDIKVPDSDLISQDDAQGGPPAAPVSEIPDRKKGRRVGLATGLSIIVFAAFLSLWYVAVVSFRTDRQEKKNAAPVEAVPAPAGLPLDNFFVEVQDEQGRERILRCNVILDIEGQERRALLTNEVAIRKKIYQVIGRRSAPILFTPEEKKRLKKDIADELNRLLGRNVIKDVYFDQYILL